MFQFSLILLPFTGPKDKLFVRLQEAWQTVGHDENDLTMWQWPVDPADYRHQQATEVRRWLEAKMQQGVFARNRDDYRELMECAAKYLGAQVRTYAILAMINISFSKNAFHTIHIHDCLFF